MIINSVGNAVTAITARLTSLSSFDGTESKVGQYMHCISIIMSFQIFMYKV